MNLHYVLNFLLIISHSDNILLYKVKIMKLNIAIYIDNSGIYKRDITLISSGNPGMGGTEYLTFLLAYELAKLKFVNVELLLASNQVGVEIFGDSYRIVGTLSKALSDGSLSSDYLIINHNNFITEKDISPLIKHYKHKTIVWSRNYLSEEISKVISENSYIVKNVFVGKQMYDYHRHYKAIKKSTYIFHAYKYPVEESINAKPIHGNITYIGSLVKAKSFHVLADQWKDIVDMFPHAELNVIGSGKTYNQSKKLGKFGIAEPHYEKRILKNLLDERGNIIESVIFHGNLGKEKKTILEKTWVGVVNPLGITETFCLSVLDFYTYGIPVVSINDFSLPNVIKHKRTGLLYNNPKKLKNKIIDILNDQSIRDNLGIEAYGYARKKFSFDRFVSDWIKLIQNIENDKHHKILSISPPLKMKKLKITILSYLQPLFNYRIPPKYAHITAKDLISKIFRK